MKNRILSMLTFFCLVSGSAWAQTFTQGDLKFTVTDADAKTVSVAKDNNDIEGDLVLPSTVSNEGVTYTVTTVANNGFSSASISSLTIPATVTALGNRSFSYCHSLTSITIQDSSEPLSIVTYSDNATFYATYGDKSIYIGRDITMNANTGAFPNAVSVEFGSQVTTICKYLFFDANKLSNVVIGNGVKTIGEYAFKSSGDNTDYVGELSVTMGENVETIGVDAFNSCPTLYSITLPSTLKVIEGYAFSSTGLTGISIPASVDSIGYGTFGYNSNLSWIRIEDSTEPLKMWRGTDYGSFRSLTADKSVYVGRDLELSGDSKITIVSNATSIEIGDQVTAINPYMFYDANKLSSLVIGNGVKTIGEYAFKGSGDNTDYVGELSVTMGENVETIGVEAFNSCTTMYSVTLPSSLKVIEGYAFSSSGLTGISIPASVDSIGYGTFGYNPNMTWIRIEDSTEPLKMWRGTNYGTFRSLGADKSVYVGRDLELSGDSQITIVSNATSIEIGDQVTTINPYMFYDANKLSSLVIGNGVKTIGEQAFRDSGDDTNVVGELSVTMGENVESIGANAFYTCSTLRSITLPSTLKSIGNAAFQETLISTITIPSSVESLGQSAFAYCPLNSITFEDGDQPLTMTNGSWPTFRSVSTDFSLYLGRNLNYETSTSSPFVNVTSVAIGPKVTNLPQYLFYNCDKLITVEGGENVETMGVRVYWACDNLESISPLGKNLKVLPESTFENCPKINGIVLPDGLEEIQQWAFHSCKALTELTIPASVTVIGTTPDGGDGYRVFYANTAMQKLVFEDSEEPLRLIDTRGDYFRGMSALETVYLGRNLNYATSTSSPFTSVTSVTIGPKVTNLPQYLFYNCDKLITVTGGENVETMGVRVYWDCNNLESISPLGKNLKVLPESTFELCEKLDGIVLPDGLEEIQQWVFHSCKALTELTIPGSVKVIGIKPDGGNGYRPFRSNQSMKKLVLEDSEEPLRFIDTQGEFFRDMTALETVYMGRDITLVGSTNIPFAAANSIEFGPAVTEIGNYFKNVKPTSVKAPWTTPIAITDAAFNNDTYQNATLWLPGGTRVAYAEADGWKNFVNVDFASFLVTGTATAGGTLAFADLTVTNGSESVLIDRETDVTFTVAPEANYDFTSLTVNGEAVNVENNTYTYPNLLTDIDVKATFTEKPKFEIKATATGGTVSLNGANFSASQTIKVYRDTDVTLAIAAAEGYENPKVVVNGQDVTAQLQDNTLTLEDIQEAKTIVVTYTKMKFQIAAEPTQNGSITLSKNVVEWGDGFTATFTPATGYDLATATLNGEDVTAYLVDGVLTVNNVRENKTVGATFQKQTYTVSISGGGVTVSNMNPQYGDNVTVTIDDDPDLTLVTLLVNGQDVTAQVVNGQYVIQNVTGDITIEATFRSTKEFITLTSEFATFSCPQDLNFTGSDLCAYIASGFNKATNQVLLTRVYDVPAGTGVFLMGETGKTYKIPYSETTSIYMNFFVANLQKSTINATTGNFSNYIFSEQGGAPGFYPIDETATLLAQTAYLQLPTSFVAAGAKVSIVFEDDIIDGTSPLLTSPEEEEQVYDLAGRRLGKTQRGINIVNGKKILVK